jgi:hypothetical protein
MDERCIPAKDLSIAQRVLRKMRIKKLTHILVVFAGRTHNSGSAWKHESNTDRVVVSNGVGSSFAHAELKIATIHRKN